MIYMQNDGRLWNCFCYFLTFTALMVLFLVVSLAIMMEMNFGLFIFGGIVFSLLLWGMIKNFVGMVRGLRIKFYIAKDEHLS